MKFVVSAYRGSHKTQHPRQVIGVSTELDSREKADALKGKKAIWTTSSGKTIEGTVSGAHGNSGAIRIRLEKGLPGQALGTEIEIK